MAQQPTQEAPDPNQANSATAPTQQLDVALPSQINFPAPDRPVMGPRTQPGQLNEAMRTIINLFNTAVKDTLHAYQEKEKKQ